MEFQSFVNKLKPWGITLFDENYGGLPNLTFNLLRTCNKATSISAIGHFLKAGIEQGEHVVLVGFDNPAYLFENFKEYGVSFDDELLSEQFIYLYYKPFFSHSLNFATNHKKLLDEVKSLSKGNIGRIAFLNTDVLFNLETHLLAESSAERIVASFNDVDCLIMGSYQATDTNTHQRLDEVSKNFLNSYYEIKLSSNNNKQEYELIAHKSPLLHAHQPIDLDLTYGNGFNSPKVDLIIHG